MDNRAIVFKPGHAWPIIVQLRKKLGLSSDAQVLSWCLSTVLRGMDNAVKFSRSELASSAAEEGNPDSNDTGADGEEGSPADTWPIVPGLAIDPSDEGEGGDTGTGTIPHPGHGQRSGVRPEPRVQGTTK